MSEKTENSSSNNRWWESYLVRYFLGFIVGSICVAIIARFADLVPGSVSLMHSAQQAVDTESKYGVTTIVISVALLGLAYCYVASTPITVLHAGRYIRGPADRLSRFFWFGWVSTLCFLMAFPSFVTYQFPYACYIYTAAFLLSIVIIIIYSLKSFGEKNVNVPEGNQNDDQDKSSSSEYKNIDNWLIVGFFVAIYSLSQIIPLWLGVQPKISEVRLMAMGAPVIWIGIIQYFVLIKILKNPAANYDFYKRLFAARQQSGAKDVRDTYSHLREHSNAIFIVAIEISMLALMLGGIRLERAANITHDSPLDGATFWLCALGIWIVPTIFMWSRANAMEKYFSENPDEFNTEKSKPLKTRIPLILKCKD